VGGGVAMRWVWVGGWGYYYEVGVGGWGCCYEVGVGAEEDGRRVIGSNKTSQRLFSAFNLHNFDSSA
jgi:hypothetical protein